MRRKAAIALMLALVLLASSLSAAAAYRDGSYNGYYYELVATCSGNDVYIRTSVKVARTQRRYLPIFIAIAVVSGIQLWGQSLQNQVSR